MRTVTPTLDHPRLVVGYHGCDRSLVEHVLVNRGSLKPSRNPWDWLGHGVYFWEQSMDRAWEFAHEQRARGRIQQPAVIGAYLHLGRCLDLTDRWATRELADWHARYVAVAALAGRPLPSNPAACSSRANQPSPGAAFSARRTFRSPFAMLLWCSAAFFRAIVHLGARHDPRNEPL